MHESPATVPNAEGEPSKVPRFLLVDSIRGIAAMAVVFRHLFYNPTFGKTLEQVFPTVLQQLSVWGAAGVYAFFVLSGFVIAHSLRNNKLNAPAIGNFILRRQVRLDLPYWVIILILLGPRIARLVLYGTPMSEPLSVIVANMFYLQNIFHVNQILGVAWTLCLEIQFYVVFILILKVGSVLRNVDGNVNVVTVGLMFISGAFCLAFKHLSFYPAWFFSYWHYFSAGVLGYWAINRTISVRLLGLYMIFFAVSCVFSPLHGINKFESYHSLSFTGMLVGFVTTLLLVYVGLQGKMESWGNNRVLLYLGKISYSIYLIHTVVIANVSIFAGRFGYEKPVVALGTWFGALILSLIAAHVLHLTVEKPSMRLASALRRA